MSVTLLFCLQCSCKKCLSPCDSAGFNTLYYVLFCLFVSTCVLQSVCVHTMDFVSAHKQINKKTKKRNEKNRHRARYWRSSRSWKTNYQRQTHRLSHRPVTEIAHIVHVLLSPFSIALPIATRALHWMWVSLTIFGQTSLCWWRNPRVLLCSTQFQKCFEQSRILIIWLCSSVESGEVDSFWKDWSKTKKY